MQNAIVRDSGGSSMCETDFSPWQMGELLLRWFHLYQIMCAFALLSNVFFFVLRMEEHEELDRHFVHDFLLIHVLERIAEYLKCSLLNHQQLGSLQRKLLKSGTCSSPKAAAKALFSFFFCTARWCNWCIHEAAGFDWHYCRVDRFYLLYHLVDSSEVFMIPHVLPCFVGMFRKLNQQKHVRLTMMKVVKGQWNWAMCCTLKDWWRNHIVRRFGFCWKMIETCSWSIWSDCYQRNVRLKDLRVAVFWLPTDQLRSNITAVWFVIAMPTCMAIYFGLVYLCRGRVDRWKEAEALVLRIVWDACNRYRLVADYFQRPQMNEAFSVASGSLRTRLWHNMAQDFLI